MGRKRSVSIATNIHTFRGEYIDNNILSKSGVYISTDMGNIQDINRNISITNSIGMYGSSKYTYTKIGTKRSDYKDRNTGRIKGTVACYIFVYKTTNITRSSGVCLDRDVGRNIGVSTAIKVDRYRGTFTH
jgi:hypothetical protein